VIDWDNAQIGSGPFGYLHQIFFVALGKKNRLEPDPMSCQNLLSDAANWQYTPA
jgi:hypothetical protein